MIDLCHTETVEAVESHGGHCSEDAGEDKVHQGALHQIDQKGRATGENHREAEKELAAELVHAEDGPEVAGQRGQGHDEAVDEHIVTGDVEGAVEGLLV